MVMLYELTKLRNFTCVSGPIELCYPVDTEISYNRHINKWNSASCLVKRRI